MVLKKPKILKDSDSLEKYEKLSSLSQDFIFTATSVKSPKKETEFWTLYSKTQKYKTVRHHHNQWNVLDGHKKDNQTSQNWWHCRRIEIYCTHPFLNWLVALHKINRRKNRFRTFSSNLHLTHMGFIRVILVQSKLLDTNWRGRLRYIIVTQALE